MSIYYCCWVLLHFREFCVCFINYIKKRPRRDTDVLTVTNKVFKTTRNQRPKLSIYVVGLTDGKYCRPCHRYSFVIENRSRWKACWYLFLTEDGCRLLTYHRNKISSVTSSEIVATDNHRQYQLLSTVIQPSISCQ